jgi:hypothetical protein
MNDRPLFIEKFLDSQVGPISGDTDVLIFKVNIVVEMSTAIQGKIQRFTQSKEPNHFIST